MGDRARVLLVPAGGGLQERRKGTEAKGPGRSAAQESALLAAADRSTADWYKGRLFVVLSSTDSITFRASGLVSEICKSRRIPAGAIAFDSVRIHGEAFPETTSILSRNLPKNTCFCNCSAPPPFFPLLSASPSGGCRVQIWTGRVNWRIPRCGRGQRPISRTS